MAKSIEENKELNRRISEIRKVFCGNSNEEFAAKLGISTSRASTICNSEPSIGLGVLERISAAFPEVSRNWLFFGEGDMYGNNVSINGSNNAHIGNSVNPELIALLAKKDEQIDRLLTIIEKQNGND